jgi:sulfate permease, SulP family
VRIELDRQELAGAVGDIGVLVPISVVLIVSNGLSATAALVPAGLLYLTAAFVYRLPVPVQPLKAFGAIAIAKGLGSEEIAAGALLMGIIFLVLGRTGLIDQAARAFPRPLIRGVQLTVGLLLLKIAWKLLDQPPKAFAEYALDPSVGFALGAGVLVAAILFRRRLVTLALIGVGGAVVIAQAGGDLSLGPSKLDVPGMDADALITALTVLVIPQAPLTFANSCLATADAARRYFGDRSRRVTPGRLASTLGAANLLSGAIAGMPVCHGAGGMTAHYQFGARGTGAPFLMGIALLGLAFGAGSSLALLLAAFPLPILAGMLAAAGVFHIALLRDLAGAPAWALALAIGALGFAVNLALALLLGLALWWLPQAALAVRGPRPARA